MPSFSVWTGTNLSNYNSLTQLRLAIHELNPNMHRYNKEVWIVKAGEGGTWQNTWDTSGSLVPSGYNTLKALVDLGKKLNLTVVPYVVIRGREAWNQAEWQQILDCYSAAGKVILNLEPGDSYWNGPVTQKELQDNYINPLFSMLPYKPNIQLTAIPRQWVVDALGGLPCLAAWLAKCRSCSWEMYDASAVDLSPVLSISRINEWANTTGWGWQHKYKIPIIQRSRIPLWHGYNFTKYGLEVWNLDSD